MRLDVKDAALLVVDIQVGLFQLVKDIEPRAFRNNILGFSALGTYFDLPAVLTTSAETGPNGPMPEEITSAYPDAAFIKRPGQVNAWDNEDFRTAVKAVGKKQLIVAGITTDVCVTFLALSLREAGYDVWVVAEACGTFDKPTAELAHLRMLNAGVTIVSLFGAACELMRDWRDAPGGPLVAQDWYRKWLPNYDMIVRSYRAVAGVEEGSAK
ncbi:protein ycaC [Exidia glandulosa HHB12029]|uniref:Protein ycaC n=1 Tax=Exidia glandulosa HHB12029 TaxID=1314781 RepID=A0A165EY41_EXIGL|nr:protein ycaC [Exidia glandulosa HHB12029]